MDSIQFASRVRSQMDDLYLQLLKTLSTQSYQDATHRINDMIERCYQQRVSVDDTVTKIRRLSF